LGRSIKYDLISASVGISYSFSGFDNKYIRSLETAFNLTEIKLYSYSSLGSNPNVPIKLNLGVRYDAFDLLYVPNAKMYIILNGEYDGYDFNFGAGTSVTIRETLSAMVSYDGTLNFGLGIYISGIKIAYWIDPGIMNSALGVSQRVSVLVDFDILARGGVGTYRTAGTSGDPEVVRRRRDDLFARALMLYDEAKFAESIKVLNEVLELDPTFKRGIELMKSAGDEIDRILKEQEKS
jgi:hypothetical protein